MPETPETEKRTTEIAAEMLGGSTSAHPKSVSEKGAVDIFSDILTGPPKR